ncbi:M35 family metallo-endopeptidase [uncultured Thiodictyon sp.]|uniref:M35 family metallo-endopeptidase n=1 Tax=uncultured Thiodictyon sp. TaxID=1846217 RepID=UPI0025E14553|nr:M35 family metallo-endopeptidase [uncultured Thiodictyon sp.]
MKSFDEVYDKARSVVRVQVFQADWQAFLRDSCMITSFLAVSGFDGARPLTLDAIRQRIADEVKSDLVSAGTVIYDAATNTKSTGNLAERAATIKFLKHMYLGGQAGAQSVWVYAPPKADGGWIFDELLGLDATKIQDRLNREGDIFSEQDRAWMYQSLMTARKITMDAVVKLSGGVVKSIDESTKALIKRWFLQDSDSDTILESAAPTLFEGMKKLAAACNRNSFVFSDEPKDRAAGWWDELYGSADASKAFPIVYLAKLFINFTGNSGKMWQCALTVVHELSHAVLSTRDHRYDEKGLKPSPLFPYEKTIENADNWSYFILDLAGYLSEADRLKAWK